MDVDSTLSFRVATLKIYTQISKLDDNNKAEDLLKVQKLDNTNGDRRVQIYSKLAGIRRRQHELCETTS